MGDSSSKEVLRSLPAVDELLRQGVVAEALETYPRSLVVRAVRDVLERNRRAFLQGAFRTSDLGLIDNAINNLMKVCDFEYVFFSPYLIARDYLVMERDPAILERQHPEMRDAVMKLVNVFDGKVEADEE